MPAFSRMQRPVDNMGVRTFFWTNYTVNLVFPEAALRHPAPASVSPLYW